MPCSLPEFGLPLLLALTCVGADGASVGLIRQGWVSGVHFLPTYVFGTSGWLQSALEIVNGPALAMGFRLGPIDGDILSDDVDVSQWDQVDAIMSGPPCPPWSSMGHHAGRDDDRARVFDRVTDLIASQGHKGCYLSIVEMVLRFDHKRQWEQWVAQITARAPMWRCPPLLLSSRDYLLA